VAEALKKQAVVGMIERKGNVKAQAADNNKFTFKILSALCMESFLAILKRGIIGQFHKVSKKYLNKYFDEFC
jgi:hypothetical protein